jgi:hypothetical protein
MVFILTHLIVEINKEGHTAKGADAAFSRTAPRWRLAAPQARGANFSARVPA